MVSLVSHRSTAVDAASIAATTAVSSATTTGIARSFQGKSLHMSLATPALIEFEDLRFYIVDCPTESTLPIYMQKFTELNVNHVARVCDSTYNANRLESAGIHVHVRLGIRRWWLPPLAITKQWLALTEQHQAEVLDARATGAPLPAIAVHCVAGLGRAPVFVCIALIEHGMDPLDAIDYVRQCRRGALNSRQVDFLARTKDCDAMHSVTGSVVFFAWIHVDSMEAC
ncbi:protein-tyrosine phosphatase-like protein [Syncephalis plumigaleata]|nr:protein-tyrosine phosphatase-like protein [Syncephalis plumigaleata]